MPESEVRSYRCSPMTCAEPQTRRWRASEEAMRRRAPGYERQLSVMPDRWLPRPALRYRGGLRRGHFYHRVADGSHGAEALAHYTSKALLAARIRELYLTRRFSECEGNLGRRPSH